MKKLFLLIAGFAMAFAQTHAQKSFKLESPDGHVSTQISLGDVLTYDIQLDGQTLMAPSATGLKLDNGQTLGANPQLRNARRTAVSERMPMYVYRANEVTDNYNALTLNFKGNYSVEFRAYNDGVAYRYATTDKKPFNVVAEQAEFVFTPNSKVTASYVNGGKDGDFQGQFSNSFENIYSVACVKDMNAQRMSFLPVYIDGAAGKVCLTETNLEGFPGLYLLTNGNNALTSKNAPYPKEVKQGGHNNLEDLVVAPENFIAKVSGPRTFPWRVAIVSKDDAGIAASTLSYQLGEPTRLDDVSWVKPGKVAWDWWNDWNISGVDFRAGINTETYKYYIDFAASKGIEYVILDEGWAVNLQADLMQVIPEIDLKGIVDYGKQKGVGIILWAGYHAFNRDIEGICRHYSEMGVKGFKIDFMNRDDQPMTEFIYRAADVCAKYHLLADFHGMYKPSGLNRTYPNVINFEGVHGLEQMKWEPATVDQLAYDVTLPFIRQAAGPMDYTQGAMLNGGVNNYHPCNSEPMSQGTRCHQLGMYVVFDSPLNMLCDSPTNYLREVECTDFIASVPTTWDETRILDGKLGEYIITARRKGDVWYIGGMTNRSERDVTIDTSFLNGYKAQLFQDGVNADRKGADYKKVSVNVGSSLKIHMAPGGGFAMKLQK